MHESLQNRQMELKTKTKPLILKKLNYKTGDHNKHFNNLFILFIHITEKITNSYIQKSVVVYS